MPKSANPPRSFGHAARSALTNSSTPSITTVGGGCLNPSGRASTHSGNGGARWVLDLLGIRADGQRHEDRDDNRTTQDRIPDGGGDRPGVHQVTQGGDDMRDGVEADQGLEPIRKRIGRDKGVGDER
jgi:hypothetical protein